MSNGFTASEIESMKNNDHSQWGRVHQQYDEWQKSIRVLSVRGAYVLGAVGIGLFFLIDQEMARIAGFAILLYTVSSYQKWEGHREGYTDGYSAGLDDGVNRALGINDEQAAFIHEVAMNAEIGL